MRTCVLFLNPVFIMSPCALVHSLIISQVWKEDVRNSVEQFVQFGMMDMTYFVRTKTDDLAQLYWVRNVGIQYLDGFCTLHFAVCFTFIISLDLYTDSEVGKAHSQFPEEETEPQR